MSEASPPDALRVAHRSGKQVERLFEVSSMGMQHEGASGLDMRHPRAAPGPKGADSVRSGPKRATIGKEGKALFRNEILARD